VWLDFGHPGGRPAGVVTLLEGIVVVIFAVLGFGVKTHDLVVSMVAVSAYL
jgi:hypothetical protein